MQLMDIDGVRTAIIDIFIDPEHAFHRLGLTEEQGGCLYVPEGEKVCPVMGEIVEKSRNTIFIIGQDYHPRNHISFMTNHPGVMEYRIEQFKTLLEEHGQPVPDEDTLRSLVQQPVHFFYGFDQPPVPFPFPEMVLDENRNIVGLKELDGRIRKVEVKTESGKAPDERDRGRISKVMDDYFDRTYDEFRAEGVLLGTQTLWSVHGVQGTESSLYPDELNLPEGLKAKLKGDLKSPFIKFSDEKTGNEFWVIRKGDKSEIDSYGIGVENDGETLTPAFGIFQEIARELKRLGCQRVVINGGGLATNFCTEFSLNNVNDFLSGFFKMANMSVDLRFVPEISRGIPIPGGPEVPFSLGGVEGRLADRGIRTTTAKEILEMAAAGQKAKSALTANFPGNTM